ncbi:polysaccharide biosynthesis protein [Paenibacillus alginolyticus]|uniref:polysaccharide biosynthesis protein n=1 Tax=Paenibacillus alginolyticus TaxID=59839 RepID=UPI00398B78DE
MTQKQRILILLSIDSLIVIFAVFFSFLLRFDFNIDKSYKNTMVYMMILQTVITLFSLHFYKIYKRLWQHASVRDILSIIKATMLASSVFFIVHFFLVHYFFRELIIPRSVFILVGIITVLTISGTRLAWRLLYDGYKKIQPHQKRILIIGAGKTGTTVVKELKHSDDSDYYPIAFIDDDLNKRNLEILGVPVVGNRLDIPTVVSKYEIHEIIIAIPSASKIEIADIISICKMTGKKTRMIPNIQDVINGKLSVSMIRNVSVEDLLGRDPVQANLYEVSEYLKNRVILVTGAGGSIGSELCRQVAGYDPEKLILLGHGENSIYEIEMELKRAFPHLQIEPVIADIQDKQRMRSVFFEFAPEVVFHAAAHKHVPLMEKNPIEAVKNNIFGTKNVAECAHEFQVKRFVMISTDKAVNSTNVMGATKRTAEMIIQQMNKISETQFAAVRFGNVLGSRGSVIPLFKKQIEQGGPVTITHSEMTRYFMTIPEAVQLVIQTGSVANGGEIFILDMGKPMKIADLARDLIKLSGLEPGKDIDIVYTGIRPGEKLYEELLTDEEGTTTTKHNRIYIGRPSNIAQENFDFLLKRLEMVINPKDGVFNNSYVRKILKQIVPTYQLFENAQDIETMEKAAKEAVKASLEIVATVDGKGH